MSFDPSPDFGDIACSMESLALAIEVRDAYTRGHCDRTGRIARALGQCFDLEPAQLEQLELAAHFHDVGKIGVPDNVLKKPGPLTPEERAVMNRHAAMGAEILGASDVPLFRLASEVALSHHERFDGAGYPRGLAGTDIPLSGRIVAVVDYFDALTMDRCYRPAIADDTALAMLERERGRLFDPAVADAFLTRADQMVALRERINQRRPQFSALIDDETLSLSLA